MTRFMNAPKALLPLWLLAAIVLVATFAGAALADAAGSGWAGAIVAVAISWPAAMLARRQLAKRGRTGFENLPSADWDYEDSPGVQALAETANPFVLFGVGLSAGGLATAAGLGGDSDAWGIPSWVVCGVLAAGPALIECDARIGLWVRRRREREEERIEGIDATAPAGLQTERPSTGGPAIAGDDEPQASPDGSLVVPLKRRAAIGWGVGSIAGGVGGLVIAVLGTDLNGLERVILFVTGPLFVAVGVRWLHFLRAPYFLRISPSGADLMGAGEVPWDAFAFATVSSHSMARWLGLALAEPLGDQPWATDRMRPLAKRSEGAELEAMLRLSSWPAERVTAAVRRTGNVDVEAYLA